LLSETSLDDSCKTERACTQKHERGGFRYRWSGAWLEGDVFGGKAGIAAGGGYKTRLDGGFIGSSKEVAG
jgi:hypothetical protein